MATNTLGFCTGCLVQRVSSPYTSLKPKIAKKAKNHAGALYRLPCAATCFNTLYLPGYSSKEVMLLRLQQASSAQHIFDEG